MVLSLKVITINTAATIALFATTEMATTSTALTHFNDKNSNNQNNINENNIIPPFNSTDSKIVTKCAIIAQNKRQQQQRNTNKNLTAINNFYYNNENRQNTFLFQKLTNDANESYLNDLPINQAK